MSPKENDVLRQSLKGSKVIVRQYVKRLTSENARLQSRIAQLEAKLTSSKNRISALENEAKKYKDPVIVQITKADSKVL
jgi:predicted  nucleic acid-binding Zn-ribbon protein